MAIHSALPIAAALVLVLGTVSFLRLLYILPSTAIRRDDPATTSRRRNKKKKLHMVVVLGSGGHTAEMMSLLRDIDPRRYTHRTYIVSSGDDFSSEKALEIEKTIQAKYLSKAINITQLGEWSQETGIWDIQIVPRARKIHQPLYTAPISSLWCLLWCLWTLSYAGRALTGSRNQYPDVIITNGPATAVIVILAAFLLKFFAFAPSRSMRILYVESWARVKTLSLSGKILLRTGLCDGFYVQWETLAKGINGEGRRKRVEWAGFLVE